MNKQQTVTINGVAYDAHTGMRIGQNNTATQPKNPVAKSIRNLDSVRRPSASSSLHSKQQRTQTLNRQHVHAPVASVKKQPSHAITHTKRAAHPIASQQVKSPMVKRFAADIAVKAPTRNPVATSTPDIAATPHPAAVRAHAAQSSRKQSAFTTSQPRPAQEIKHRAISEAMQKTASSNHKTKKARKSFIGRHPRMTSIATASLALVLLAGYLTYINLPTISVRVAASQAGIAAAYPSYQPSGYSLKGPVAFSEGQVSMKFAANAGPQNFTVNQVKSNWDSSALLDNYVYQASSGDYDTFKDNGLTIYIYGNDAAWINDGILHTIKGDANLTNDQIRKLATSM